MSGDVNQLHLEKLESLPEGWADSSVTEIVQMISANNKKLAQKKYLQQGEFPVIDQGQDFIGGYSDDKSLVIEEEPPFIIFGDHTRAFKFANFKFVPGADGVKIMKPLGVDPKWCFYILQAIKIPNKGYARHFQYLKEAYVPVPPPEQQKRIVAKIEELFSHIDAGIEALKKAKQLLKQYRQSVLKAAVTGELTKEWREARLKDDAQGSANVAGGTMPGATKLEPASQLLERILKKRREKWEEQQLEQFEAKGKMPKDDKWKARYKFEARNPHMVLEVPLEWTVSTLESITDPIRVICYGILMPKENVEDGVLYVKVKDIKGGKVLLHQLNRTSPEIAQKYDRASLVEGDLLLTIRGSYGRTAIAPADLEGGNITQDTVRISSISPVLNKYIQLFIDSVVAQHYFKLVARGVAVRGVNVQDVRNMDVSIPSREEQDEIIRVVDEKIISITHLENELDVQLIKATKQKQSILASAFSGNLYE